jgi:hypothetical protein
MKASACDCLTGECLLSVQGGAGSAWQQLCASEKAFEDTYREQTDLHAMRLAAATRGWCHCWKDPLHGYRRRADSRCAFRVQWLLLDCFAAA